MAKTTGKKKDEEVTFENALKRLEKIVTRLEESEVPLEEALSLFEEGVKLSRICSTRLDKAQQRLEILEKDRQGKSVLSPFSPEEKVEPDTDIGAAQEEELAEENNEDDDSDDLSLF